jgi:N-acetylglucosaminyldiphosphoundecaprenol N-acetyl-beta-D-mannosaminyltransferase
MGRLWVDAVTFRQALARIEALVDARAGGAVFTPNVDHVVTAEVDPAFRDAYAAASLVLADGMPIVWGSRLLGTALPEKISGSDLVWPLLELAATRGWRVYLLGGAPGVAEAAGRRVAGELGVHVVGVDSPEVSLDPRPGEDDPVVERVRKASPDLLLVALGAPKQERWIHRNGPRLGPAVALGVGASLDFVAGRLSRAPRWMSRGGLEWLYRLFQDPRWLWRRYLLKDGRFLFVLWRMARSPRAARVAAAPALPAAARVRALGAAPDLSEAAPPPAVPPGAASPPGSAAARGPR